eukprot:scpid61802/ scgid4113/ 
MGNTSAAGPSEQTQSQVLNRNVHASRGSTAIGHDQINGSGFDFPGNSKGKIIEGVTQVANKLADGANDVMAMNLKIAAERQKTQRDFNRLANATFSQTAKNFFSGIVPQSKDFV